MAFVATCLAISSSHSAVIHVRPRRNAEKSSWKRLVSKSEVEGLSVDSLRVSGFWKDVFHTLERMTGLYSTIRRFLLALGRFCISGVSASPFRSVVRLSSMITLSCDFLLMILTGSGFPIMMVVLITVTRT